MYTDVMLTTLTYPDATPDQAIRSGVALGKKLGGALGLLSVKVDIPAMRNVFAKRLFGLEDLAREAEARSSAATKAAADCAQAAAEAAGAALEITTMTVAPNLEAEAVAVAARTRDLMLLPVGPAVLSARAVAEAVLFGSGRPIVIYPEALEIVASPDIGAVVVAWDGSARAARVLADAMPILRRAADVQVYVAVGEKPQTASGAATDLMRHLLTHGVAAKLVERPAAGQPIGALLREHVRAAGADLLVMGGFGHARVREFVLGGATQAMLEDPPCPILLSH